MNDTRRLEARGRWPADIDLWHLNLPAQAGVHDWSCLSGDERERAARYRQPADRIRFALTRCRLRRLLAGYLGLAPEALRFGSDVWGRPELAGGGLSFNVSHGGKHALIAVSVSRRVGVDVEWIDPALDWRALTGLLCTSQERQAILTAVHEARRQAFFRCWTAKEALFKADGRGIGAGLRSVNLAAAGKQFWTAAGGTAAVGGCRLQYRWLDELNGYSACLAYGEPGSALTPQKSPARQRRAGLFQPTISLRCR